MALAFPLIASLEDAKRPVRQLVENRTLYESHGADLAIYDTYERAEHVRLDAEQVMYCGMLSGKKVLHTADGSASEFLPHESFVMSPGDKVFIDFPEAQAATPTTCLTLSFSPTRITETCQMLDKQAPLESSQSWIAFSSSHLHTHHSGATQNLLKRIVEAFLQRDHDRDLVLTYGVNELLSRMVRQYGHQALLQLAKMDPTHNALTAVLSFIETHLTQPISIDNLCHIACMSRSKLYQQFSALADCSPMEYVQQRRLHFAKTLLISGQSVTQACLNSGFVNVGHFSRRFQLQFGVPPSKFAKDNLAH